MQAVYVIDIFENNYMIVEKSQYLQLESSELTKNDYFGYIDSNNKFVSCKAHKDKYPQATFVICDTDKILRIKSAR